MDSEAIDNLDLNRDFIKCDSKMQKHLQKYFIIGNPLFS